MDIDHQEARAIADELRRWHDEARSLIDDAADKSRLSPTGIDSLKTRLSILKNEIKEAAKHETLSRRKTAKTELEQCFFGPAVRSTSANFRLRTDTSPKSELWARGLHEVEFELSYSIDGLERFVAENS
ncbi:TPA: hypothetical protein L3631_006040 [Pseudomonas aeruginosa]|uniref:Uncharacterized protein n=1 Tax=Pseudomonas phage YMC11/02/R656 TaxID=1755689 RepID=A0A0S2SYH9_9CAUD|nr:hypothetical protein [Pseudomonas aeruginosa]YP_009187481.1 hypothetical protein AU162_gp084 [Pseudomonas phage YMC11/02/R656]ALP47905.1 hypothetical protein BPPAER656_00840 [Pseudomonas phage YMC11/02/R656]AYZ83530.1 hypothetical protein EGY27_12005 [Pseudomonas aeruginosa]KJC14113.1 hypothetical protein TO65_30375 [Pseudomonas aeruginosa]KYO85139.1 hypothetical protein LT19_05173 [Pseudomonas aeruginosa]MBO7955764.1 hypothetical protein [Pseudomonas aeruginosa]